MGLGVGSKKPHVEYLLGGVGTFRVAWEGGGRGGWQRATLPNIFVVDLLWLQ